MSAFEVSNLHLSAMLTGGFAFARTGGRGMAIRYYWGGQHREIEWGDPSSTSWAMFLLNRENRRSVAYRYREECDETIPSPEDLPTFHELPGIPDPADVVNLCDCWIYQTCEHPSYRESEAYAIVESIRESAIARLTAGSDVWEARDRSMWGSAVRIMA